MSQGRGVRVIFYLDPVGQGTRTMTLGGMKDPISL